MNQENIQDIYALSPMQQGMLFHSLYAPEKGAYVEQSFVTLEGPLDIAAFERAWNKVIERTPILRTAFVWEGVDEPLQVVLNNVDLEVSVEDWRTKSEDEVQDALDTFAERERKKGFDLAQPPLMRFALFRMQDQKYKVVWTHHHLLYDGWSQPLLMGEFFAFYEAFSRGESLELPERPAFRTFIDWIERQDQAKAEAYWRRVLKGFSSPTQLAVERNLEPEQRTGEYRVKKKMLSQADSERLRLATKENGLTLNTLMQGAWALLLSRYSRERDVLFGATVSGRPADLPGAEAIIGLFINTLPVRTVVDPHMRAVDWLRTIQENQAENRNYEYSSLVQIKKWAHIANDQPLFNSILVFESYPVEERASAGQQNVRITEQSFYSRTNFPLTVVCSPGKTIGLELAYECDLYEDQVIDQILEQMAIVLKQLAAQPSIHLGNLQLVSAEEQKRLLVDWNGAQVEYPRQACIHHLFEQQAEKRAQEPALFFDGKSMSYASLNERANQLAHYLLEQGIHREQLVAICADRSFEMIIAALAVLKAGGAYVPIDPAYPAERIAYTLHDSGASILLTQKRLLDRLPQAGEVFLLDADWGKVSSFETANPNVPLQPQNLAYVIYTSGSTGTPKGTLMQHGGLVSFVLTEARFFGVDEKSRVLQFASFSFDASVGEIFKALVVGATLYLAPREILLAVDDLTRFLNENEIDTVTLPPSLLAVMEPEKLPHLRVVASVGEACNWELVRRWANGRKFINGYGPTETTVGAIWGEVNERDVDTATPPIGHPIDNAEVYILDADLNPVPVSVPGEIYISGTGISRGYLNRPDLTAERFVPNPFSSNSGARMYRTGDLARWLPDRRIVFEGRVDFQVKLRGFRIELGEIESLLTDMPQIRDAAVIVREDKPGRPLLVAYLTPKEDMKIDVNVVAEALEAKLPDYMRPSAFVVMDSLPLTPNGKVDRKALPAPDQAAVRTAEHVDPRTTTEELVAGIFQDVLHLDRVSVLDNFFNLGGHSLLATQLLSRLREAFEVELPLQMIFEHPTVAELAAEVDEAVAQSQGKQAPPIAPAPRDTKLPLSFSQQRLWFLDQLEPGKAFYNIPVALRLRGQLDETALNKALNDLVARHESLRTYFQDKDGKPYQLIEPELDIPLSLTDLTAVQEGQREKKIREMAVAEATTPFHLEQAPLFRASLIRAAMEDHVILFTMHHIIGDGWSVNVIIREISELYRAHVQGKKPALPPLPIQYADFAVWQRHWLQGDVLQSQLNYWKQKLAGSPPMLELPTDYPRPPVQSFNGATAQRKLPAALSQAASAFSRREGATLFMTLLTAFASVLYRYSHQSDFNIGTPTANRTRRETEGLVGFFVNNLVLRCRFDEEPSFLDLLQMMRRNALQAFANQDIPFEMLVEKLQPQRDLSHSPLFQVVFVMQNTPMDAVELPGLTMQPVEAENPTAKFDLSLQSAESPDGIVLEMEYNSDLFKPTTIQRMLLHFELLLQNALLEPERSVGELEILPRDEAHTLLVQWNQSAAEFEQQACVHEIFERLAERQPDAVAASYEGKTLAYAELNARANQLARYLRQRHVGPDVLVAISVRRSLDQVVAVLATLKAGGAFVPVDPSYPKERIAHMLNDSHAPILLTQEGIVAMLPEHQSEVFCMDADWSKVASYSAENLELNVTPQNLAYVIYTSGSTGLPKGTMLQHQGAINLANAQRKAFDIKRGKRILQFAPMSFDASVWETVMALLNGAQLVLADQENLTTGDGLLKVLRENRITTVTLPPSVLAVVPQTPLPELETIITAGEKCTADLVDRWKNGRRYFNAYGPTETTVCASMHLCNGGYPQGPPIGKPIDNALLYVLDSHLKPVPIGVPGELCVGGPSLARGYLNRPELTAEKFIPNPFAEDGSRLYRTGDLVRWLPEGEIEFLGRIDHQVKVRGFRIELGEIEAVLDDHEKVKNVIVLAKEIRQGDMRLVAYLVADGAVSAEELRAFVRQRLPEYMTPSHFVFLDEMPLTPSGKIDRHALPMPDLSRGDLAVEYVAPRNDVEAKIAEICRDLLNVDKVGVNDNFFDLGGHSLLATQFMSRIRDAFAIEMPLRLLFERPTVAGIAEGVEELKMSQPKTETPSITAVSRDARRRNLSSLRGKENS